MCVRCPSGVFVYRLESIKNGGVAFVDQRIAVHDRFAGLAYVFVLGACPIATFVVVVVVVVVVVFAVLLLMLL